MDTAEPLPAPHPAPQPMREQEQELKLSAGQSPTLSERVAESQARLRQFAPGDDPIENLYFAWMQEPYRRATLAVAWKTLRVLEREVDLRARARSGGAGGGGLTHSQTETMLAWLTKTWGGDWNPRAPGFKPHRLAPSITDGAITASKSLFAFADRSSFTQADCWFGDFDLLACAGFRVYPVARNRPLTSVDVAAFQAHAKALRVGLLDVPLAAAVREDAAPLAGVELRLVPKTLKALLGDATDKALGEAISDSPSDSPSDAVVAVVDPPRGERWSGMLARRGFARGLRRGSLCAIGCVPPRGDRRTLASRVRAAMWVQALEGQTLGVFEGWRDVRDGTRTRYASCFSDPAYLETVAHTALDILRYDGLLSRFDSSCSLALIVGEAQLATTTDADADVATNDDNLWSETFLDLADTLLARGVRFDVLSRTASTANDLPYALIVDLSAGDKNLAGNIVFRSPRSGTRQALTFSGSDTEALANAIAEKALREDAPHIAAWFPGDDGAIVGGLYVRSATDQRTVVVVNLMGILRHLRIGVTLESWHGFGDALTGETLQESFAIGPHQVRILVPREALPASLAASGKGIGG